MPSTTFLPRNLLLLSTIPSSLSLSGLSVSLRVRLREREREREKNRERIPAIPLIRRKTEHSTFKPVP
jgi:hypothetical protein